MDHVECIVVGAGVVGLAIARALATSGRETLIVESEQAFGVHTSSRNNEVIHSGILYPPNSLKAQLCREGRRALLDFCRAHGIAHKMPGKFVIATSEQDADVLQAVEAYASANGVYDLEYLDGARARRREPNLQCLGALFSPSTGIIDSHGLMLALLGDAESAGAAIAYGSRVRHCRHTGERIAVSVAGDGVREYQLSCSLLVNAAGLGAAQIANEGFQGAFREVFFAKGSFFSYTARPPFSRLIVPVGDTLALGGAFTIDIGGQGKFGPDLEWVDRIDYSLDAHRAARFVEGIRRYYPDVDPHHLHPGYAGIRPRSRRHESLTDWIIDAPEASGPARAIHLLGIDTPGLTACLAIAEYVCDLANGRRRPYASPAHC